MFSLFARAIKGWEIKVCFRVIPPLVKTWLNETGH